MPNQTARTNMIKQQLRTGNVLDEKVLALFEELPREAFVPKAMQAFACSDMQIPLAEGQRMMTPLEEATILQALALQGGETILEVGTGSGYLTALLSRLGQTIISVDYFAEFTKTATERLLQHRCDNVELLTGDASEGWLDKAPYDVVVLTGAIEKISEMLKLQILPGGRLITLIGRAPVVRCQMHTLDHQGNWHEAFLFETSIPPLISRIKPKKRVFQDMLT